MSMKLMAAAAVASMALVGSAQAATYTINLGPSAENFILFGQGAVAPGIGSFTVQQGSEFYDAGTNTTTDTLTGTIANSTNPSLGSGTYALVTTYTGMGIGAGGGQITAQSNPSDVSQFFYTGFDSSVDMTLNLFGTPAGNFTLPLVTNGFFDGPGFSFAYTTAGCTGVGSCTQNNVGLTPGSAISGPVTISVSYAAAATPEPATWTLMLLGVGMIGGALRHRPRVRFAYA